MNYSNFSCSSSSSGIYPSPICNNSSDDGKSSLSYKLVLEKMEYRLENIHDKLDKLQREIFSRGRIENGEIRKLEEDDDEDNSEKTKKEDLQYFDPQYLDI